MAMIGRAANIGSAGLAVLVVLGLSACANQSSKTYNAAEVGDVMTTTRAVVLSSREVSIEGGETGPYGPAVGAALGGTGGFYAGSGHGTDSAIFAGLGALIGGGLGYAGEELADSRSGIEYVLREPGSDRTITVVQNKGSGEAPLPAGTKVLLQQGSRYTRVIPDPVAN